MPSIKVPSSARRLLAPVADEAAKRGLSLHAVGGCVRDWILGRATYDFDLVCGGDPSPLARSCAERLGARAEAFGAFGTLRVTGGRYRVDFSTSRRESYPEPASLPVVETPAPLAEDLRRRDFSVNAMALRLRRGASGELVDPLGGLEDLKAGTLRLLHARSLRDDPTRVFRAARYACRLGLKPAAGFEALARESLAAGHAARLSRHRLLTELWRVLAEAEPACALRRLRGWGYLGLIRDGLPDPKRALKAPEERLASLALGLGPARGLDFLSSLPIERAAAARVAEPLKLARDRQPPKEALSPAALRVLKAHLPKLPPPALKPSFLGGADLKKAGLAPGRGYGELLAEAGRLQWSGALKSRAQALAWLKKRVKLTAAA